MKKLILIIIVLVAIGGAVAAYYMKKNVVEPTVTTAQITRGDIVETVGATGTLQAVETVDVGTQVSGVVEALYADFNSIVKKGQVIARLDPSLINTAVEQREASVIRAKADLDRLRVSLADAQRKLEQAKQLWAKQLIPRDQLDTAELNVKQLDSQIQSSKASLTVAEADLNTQKVNLGHTIIKAPIDGVVISRNVDQGQTVQASMNAPTLYVIAEDLTKMQVLATIDESEIGKIRPGQAVRFTVDAQPGETFHGTVSQIRLLPTTVQNVVTYTTVIDVPNDEYKLKPGMTATVNVEIARRENVLRAPNASLRFRPTNDIFAALKQEVPPEMQRGGGRMGGGREGQGGPRAGGAGAPATAQPSTPSTTPPAGAQAPSGQQRPAQPQAQSNDRGRRDPSAQGGGDRGGERPTGERIGGGREGGNRPPMTEEQREARRKQMEERMKNMSPEERAQWEQRMREGRGGRGGGSTGSPRGNFQRGEGGGRGNAPAGAPNQRAERQGGNQQPRAPQQTGRGLANTTATTIEALFAPPVRVEQRGRLWLYVNKQLKSVPVRTGITDGTWTEIIETPETAQLAPNTEVVINVVTGLEPTNRPGQGGQGNSPLMPQRGNQPGRGGPGGGGGGRGR
jgi:HlyD family secretion protein